MNDSTSTNIIETCWPTIESYSDLEATIAIAQTCRSLHYATVDSTSNKIKVSHFEVDNSPSTTTTIPSSSLEDDDGPLIPKDWHTAPTRIPHYLSRSLNAIHFPSLRRLALDFPATKRRNSTGSTRTDIIDDACSSSLPIFVTNLSFAYNLTSLYLNAGRLMALERSGQLESLYEIFSQNLGRSCTKIRDLEVNNSGFVRGHSDPLHSVALLQALLPTIVRRRKTIERLKMVIAGCPSDPIYARRLTTNGIDPVYDFFEAALSVERLSVLELTLSMSGSTSHFNALVAAATMVGGTSEKKPLLPHLTKLRINYEFDIRHGVPLIDLPSASPLLDNFSECHSLESLFLNLPAVCWKGGENVRALEALLGNKPSLSSVTISFSFFSDRKGEMVRTIAECLAPNIASGTLCKLSIFGLRFVDCESMSALQRSLRASGMVCDKFGTRGNGGGGKLDVMILNNRKLLEGESVGIHVKDEFEEFQWMSHQHTVGMMEDSVLSP
mmetsp:Transcript_11369/g.20517  ORF Transcript_11369/g.20517 Transcript_11369/m.20517 type:complete len:497 (+) Transcript_11369:1-1491(+)